MNNFMKVFKDTYFIIKDSPYYDLDFSLVISTLNKTIPAYLVNNIDVIYFGHFQDLLDKTMTASFKDDCIYVMNTHASEQEIVDDIVHEIAHALEGYAGIHIYADGQLEKEFREKKKIVAYLMEKDNVKIPKQFFDTEYNYDMDMYFLNDIGYNQVLKYTQGLFPSPYSMNSIREYWAVCFEKYVSGGEVGLRRICPVATEKIKEVYKTCKKSR